MRVSVISAWYNEELIAPYFLNHYDEFVDEYYIILDSDTNDRTMSILQDNPKVNILPFQYPNGFDDLLKVDLMSQVYRSIKEGWVIVVDSDEFVFRTTGGCNTIKDKLYSLDINSGDYNVIGAELWHPYRNINDKDLDPSIKPIINQRRYGVKYNKHSDEVHYIKPCVAKAGLDVRWGAGQHHLHGNYNRCPDNLNGVHWQYADPQLVIDRHTKNRIGRNGPRNISMGCSTHFADFTEDKVLQECKDHLNDGRLF